MRQTKLFIILVIPVTFITSKSFGQESLDIRISNIQKNKGKVVVEIYTSKKSWLEIPYKKIFLSTAQEIQTASFKIPYGKYAISVYQDLNDNGEADMNFLGIPKELVGFGNNFKPFGEPKFESCLIEFNAASKPQEIKLYKVL